MDIFTTKEAAQAVGAAEVTIRKLASRHGIGRKIGRDWAFTERDLARLKRIFQGEPGNPNWRKRGNQDDFSLHAKEYYWNAEFMVFQFTSKNTTQNTSTPAQT